MKYNNSIQNMIFIEFEVEDYLDDLMLTSNCTDVCLSQSNEFCNERWKLLLWGRAVKFCREKPMSPIKLVLVAITTKVNKNVNINAKVPLE